jgi:hypothetical protein
MHRSNFRFRLALIVLAALVFQPLPALADDEPAWVQIKEQWGQLLFCKRIYTMPEVRPRLYPFDTEACQRAEQAIADVVSRYTTPEQKRLKNQAEQHAVKLSYNTTEPYHSVPACRQYCSELGSPVEEQND